MTWKKASSLSPFVIAVCNNRDIVKTGHVNTARERCIMSNCIICNKLHNNKKFCSYKCRTIATNRKCGKTDWTKRIKIIKWAYDAGFTQSSMAKYYGVSAKLINEIVNRR